MNPNLAKLLDRILGGAAGRLVSLADLAREAVRPPARVDRVREILILKFWGLGNWALLRPVVRDVRARWPSARITIATLANNRALVEDLADRLFLIRPRRFATVLSDLSRAVFALRRHPPDLSIDFEQFTHAGALLARLGRSRQRVGFAFGRPGRDGLYTVLVPFHQDRHASRSFRDLAEAAGVPSGPYRPGALEATPAGRRDAHAYASGAPYVLLHPGSGDNFPGRRWSLAGFAAVARAARIEGYRVVVSGGASEATLADELVRRAGPGVVSAAGALSVEGLVALISGATVLVANDTGPVHMASALEVPALGIFGPNTPVLYAPLSPGSRSFYRGLPCSPCLTTRSYRSSRCRIHTCMAAIPTGEVASVLRQLLRDAPARRAAMRGTSERLT